MRGYVPIQAPNGEFWGRYPQDGPTHTEGLLSRKLAVQVKGQVEVVIGLMGRADVATNTHVYEVEGWAKWRVGLRQVICYAAGSGLKPCLALFGAGPDKNLLDIYLKLRDDPTVKSHEVELWGFDGGEWSRVGSRKQAARSGLLPKLYNFQCSECGTSFTLTRTEWRLYRPLKEVQISPRILPDPSTLRCGGCGQKRVAEAMGELLYDERMARAEAAFRKHAPGNQIGFLDD